MYKKVLLYKVQNAASIYLDFKISPNFIQKHEAKMRSFDYKRSAVTVNSEFKREFRKIIQLWPSWLPLCQIAFDCKFGDISPSIPILAEIWTLGDTDMYVRVRVRIF